MSQLIVLTFDDTDQAQQAYDSLKKAQHTDLVSIDDAAVIIKQETGKVEIKNQMDKGTKWGAIGGGMVGLLLASVFFPVAGILIGAIGGGLIGKSLNMGVDQKFVKEVTESLKPGTSALFVIGSGNPDAIAAIFRPFKGTILQTTLPTESVEVLQDALKRKE